MENMNQEFPINLIRICINDTDEMAGYLCGLGVETPIGFANREQLFRRIGSTYDSIGQPQPNQVMRSFRKDAKTYNSYIGSPQRFHKSVEIHQEHGTAATLDLIMTSRKNSEWQGIFKSIDGEVIGRFKTALQCMKLVDELTQGEK